LTQCIQTVSCTDVLTNQCTQRVHITTHKYSF